MKKINATKEGKIFYNSENEKYHIEFKNLNFIFTEVQFLNFKKYFKELDGTYYSVINRNSYYKRSLVIPLLGGTINMLLNTEELYEIRELLDIELKFKQRASIPRFNYDFGLN